MTIISLDTIINAPLALCFDLSRDIGVHLTFARHTSEKVVGGRSSGLCEEGDLIVWEAVHLGFKQRLAVLITRIDPPYFFEDMMVKGAFKSMRHEHHFKSIPQGTLMQDFFYYEVPFGWIGRLFDRIFLRKYLKNFLLIRNQTIKNLAENK